jgi:hypothetical protein
VNARPRRALGCAPTDRIAADKPATSLVLAAAVVVWMCTTSATWSHALADPSHMPGAVRQKRMG